MARKKINKDEDQKIEAEKIENENATITEPEIQEPETKTDSGNNQTIAESQTEIAQKELERLLQGAESPKSESEFEPKKRGRKAKEAETEKPLILIPGELVVEICGNISASGLHFIDKWVSKNPVPINYLLPREDQVKRLAPLAEKFIEALKLQTDPISAFIVAMTATTFTNYILVKAMQSNEPKPESI